MDVREARREFQKGQLTAEQLLDLLEQQDKTIRRLQAELDRLKQRLAQYEPESQRDIKGANPGSDAGTQYSLEAEEKRRRRRKKKKKSPGRRPTQLKFADAQCVRDVYPPGVRAADCRLARQRPVWRLEDGRAVLVGYRVFAGPGGDEAPIPLSHRPLRVWY
jgi:uncharacterized coiled-coil protein SlyX